MDADLEGMDRAALIDEVKRLRAGIRRPPRQLRSRLVLASFAAVGIVAGKDRAREVAVPPWPKFIHGCLAYREALDRDLPDAPIEDIEYSK